jgi:hypothetical protein
MLQLIRQSILFHLDSHKANLPNLIAGTVGMVLNNVIFLIGIWGMLFAGKPDPDEQIPYFIALTTVGNLAWGGVNFFFGGLRYLGDYISEGRLESALACPKNPILLVAISQTNAMALGDICTGLLGLFFIYYFHSFDLVLKSILITFFSAGGFIGLFILSGSLSFFIARGNQIATLINEVVLALSSYPTGRMFKGVKEMIILMTPTVITVILPLKTAFNFNIENFIVMTLSLIVFVAFSVRVFYEGLKRYQTISLTGTRL